MPTRLVHVKPTKAQVAFAMLRQPAHWPDLWRRIRINVGQKLLPEPMGQGRVPATAWAAEAAMSRTKALEILGFDSKASFHDHHSDLLTEAARIERESAETLGGGGGIDLIWRVCEGLGAKTAVETGVAYGWSSIAILASIAARGGHLFSVDMPHPLLRDPGLTGAVVPETLRPAWTLIREPDHSGLSKVLLRVETIDFIHYDSDKSYLGRAASYRRLWPRLRRGGILMSDDVADNTAFRDFAAEVDVPPIVVYSEGSGLSQSRYVGLLKKR